MEFENKAPEWSAQGVEPPVTLKERGFEAGYKPPASYFNWFWSGVSACLKELIEKLTGHANNTDNPHKVTAEKIGAAKSDLENVDEDVFRNKASTSGVLGIPIVEATSDDGVDYIATVDGVSELQNGMMLTIIPNKTSTSTAITLNVNGLGAKHVRLALSFNNAAMTIPRLDTYYTEGRPITIQYDANYTTGGAWKTIKQRTSAQDLYGTVPIESGGTGATTAADARNELGITLENLGDIVIADTPPKTVTNGKWYLIKAEV